MMKFTDEEIAIMRDINAQLDRGERWLYFIIVAVFLTSVAAWVASQPLQQPCTAGIAPATQGKPTPCHRTTGEEPAPVSDSWPPPAATRSEPALAASSRRTTSSVFLHSV